MSFNDDLRDIEEKLLNGVGRGHVFSLPDPSITPGGTAPYAHQLQALSRLEQGLAQHVSGIVHLPTGAGKTRVALEFIARTLKQNPQHRFLWATHAKLLVQQSMVRAAQLAFAFPRGTRMAWYEGDPSLLDGDDVHLLFLTRTHLHQELDYAHDARTKHPWRKHLESGRPLTLIYDECHQLGGRELQKTLRKFYEKVVEPPSGRRKPWQVIGLSATPVPTSPDAHPLLQRHVFPLRDHPPPAASNWGMHVFHRASNPELRREGVLCDVNTFYDRQGTFDLPPDLIKRISGESHIRPPGANARKDEVLDYAKRFNRSVMGHPHVLRFLAERLAKNLKGLGKTIVFVPDIDAANRMVGALLDADPAMHGKVAAVHSRMRELVVPGQSERTPEEVLKRFSERGAEPCILVNVEMLTEGFDDPKVRTVVLARLTLSTNLFWQMIGRGTRGVRAGGTADCFVIDPVKLVRLYDYFAGYQPAIGKPPGGAIDDDDPDSAGLDALDPSVPAVSRPPLPSDAQYTVSAELRQAATKVAIAIEAFLRGDSVGENDAIDIATHAEAHAEYGQIVLRNATSGFHAETAQMLVLEELHRVAARLACDLSWLERQVPAVSEEDVLRYWIRKLAAVEKLGIRTEPQYAVAEMNGSLAKELSLATESRESIVPELPLTVQLPEGAAALVDVCSALAHSDGALCDAEVEATARAVIRVFGVPDVPTLRVVVKDRAAKPTTLADCVTNLRALEMPTRKLALRELVSVAAADAFIAQPEREVLGQISAALDVSRDYLDGVLDLMAP